MSNVEKAREAWGSPPDYVLRLAEAADANSQASVARQLGRSTAFVNQILRNKYPVKNLGAAAELINAHLADKKVVCPVFGNLNYAVCLQWQKCARRDSWGNNRQRQMAKTCPECPVYKGKK